MRERMKTMVSLEALDARSAGHQGTRAEVLALTICGVIQQKVSSQFSHHAYTMSRAQRNSIDQSQPKVASLTGHCHRCSKLKSQVGHSNPLSVEKITSFICVISLSYGIMEVDGREVRRRRRRKCRRCFPPR